MPDTPKKIDNWEEALEVLQKAGFGELGAEITLLLAEPDLSGMSPKVQKVMYHLIDLVKHLTGSDPEGFHPTYVNGANAVSYFPNN